MNNPCAHVRCEINHSSVRGYGPLSFLAPFMAALCLADQAFGGKREQHTGAMVGVLIWLLLVVALMVSGYQTEGLGLCSGEMVGEDCDIDCGCGAHGTQMDLKGARAACEPHRECGEPYTCDGGTCACDDGYRYRVLTLATVGAACDDLP